MAPSIDLRPDEVTLEGAIPVTTPARTLLDLAATHPRRTVERALGEAEVVRRFDLTAFEAVVEAHRGRPGAPLLAALLRSRAGPSLTRSELEERFLALCDRNAIPRPRVNARVGGCEVDFYWPDRRLAVELDGYRYHGTRAAFERDRAKDGALALAGVRVVRFTHRRLADDPGEVAGAVQLLRSMSSIRYPSGSRTKQIRDPPSRTR